MNGSFCSGRRMRGGVVVVATSLAAALGVGPAAADFNLENVMLGGHTVVPGEVETFNGPAVSWASVNNDARVSFLGSWTQAGQQFGELGMFKWQAGHLTDLMKATDLTDAPGFTDPPSSVQNGFISDTGNILFRFQANGQDAIANGPNRAGLTTILKDSDANAPGTASPFLFFNSPMHNGQYFAVNGSAGGIGIWTGAEGAGIMFRFAQEGQTQVPGTGQVINDMIFRDPKINTSGFTAAEVGYGVDGSAIIAGNPAAVNPLFTVAKTGDDTPGVVDGSFVSFGSPRLNNAGSLAFHATWADGIGEEASGLFRTSGGGLDDVAITGVTQVPGEGGMLFTALSNPTLAGDDLVYFTGQWDGYVRRGLFLHENGVGLTALFKDGEAAPGTGTTFTSFSAVHANAVGDYVFLAGLADGRKGLFASKNGGADVAKLLIEGQIIDATGDGDMAVITDLILPTGTGGEDGNGRWFNDSGELLIEIELDPTRALPSVTSGLYLVTVPEPTSLMLLGLMGVVAARRRRNV